MEFVANTVLSVACLLLAVVIVVAAWRGRIPKDTPITGVWFLLALAFLHGWFAWLGS